MQRDLVVRAMAGDHEAFSELARLVIRRLYAVARLILRDATRAVSGPSEPRCILTATLACDTTRRAPRGRRSR